MTVLSVWGFSLCFRRFYSVLAEMEDCHFGVSPRDSVYFYITYHSIRSDHLLFNT